MGNLMWLFKFPVSTSLVALLSGLILSSFAVNSSSFGQYVWFDETCDYQFVVYGSEETALMYLNLPEPGTTFRIAVGYDPDRYGTSNNPFLDLITQGGCVTGATLKVDPQEGLYGPSLQIDNTIYFD